VQVLFGLSNKREYRFCVDRYIFALLDDHQRWYLIVMDTSQTRS